jgi:hypothetical protein
VVAKLHPRRTVNRLFHIALKKYLREDDSNKLNENSDLLMILRNLIFFVAIYLYFIGWTYSYYLYSHFGISLYSLDVPFYYFFIYSYSVVLSNGWWFVVATSSLLITRYVFRNRKELRKLITILFLLVFFPLSFKLARNTAFEAALLLRKGYGQTVTIVFREAQKETQKGKADSNETETQSGSKNYPSTILNANQSGNLRLLTQTKDKLFVIYQPSADEEGGELPMCYTYVIAATDVSLTIIEAQNTPNVPVPIQNIPR